MEKTEIRSLQCNDTYFPILDGVVRTVHNYALEMNRISESYVVCPEQKEAFDDGSLPYEVIRTASLKLPALHYAVALPVDQKTLKKIVSRGRTDIVHVHSPFMLGNTCRAAARKMNVPVVATFHSKYYTDILQVTKSRLLARMVTDGIIRFYNRCDAVWACSEGTAETLRTYGYKKKITVMPNGTDMERPDDLHEAQERAAAIFRLSPDRKTLLFTGSLIWQKNLKLILDTFRILETVHPKTFRLILAGTGSHEQEVKAYAGKLNLKEVYFTEEIRDRELLAGLYSLADLFFFPSVYDNAPLVVREAAVLQTPTLAVIGSNTADVIRPDFNGFTAEEDPRAMAKKIIQIMSDTKKLKEVGRNASETIPVSWRPIVEHVYEEYDAVIKNYRRRT